MLSEEQIKNIKEQLLAQVANFAPDKKAQAEQQIKAMNSKELENFLIQNNLIKPLQGQSPEPMQCVFCSIINGKIQTYKIDENPESIAVLEINPISKGHVLVLPKKHSPKKEEISKSAFTLADKIAKKIKSLKPAPKDVSIYTTSAFDHMIINILPIYDNETPDSKRKPAKPEELIAMQKKLEAKKRKKIIKPAKPREVQGSAWFPIRIP